MRHANGEPAMRIKIFTTGGTIDKVYFDEKSTYEVGTPKISEVLKEANVNLSFTIEALFRKDSLQISENDRETIVRRVASEKLTQIVITHGTDTMIDTARRLSGISGKTIVLTGAMAPARFKSSDAAFNIGGAVTAVQILPEGVYIAMNGRIFDPKKVRKNRKKNMFEEGGQP